MVEQLKKLPVEISVLSLLQSLEDHRNALLKILKELHVSQGTSEEDLDYIVGQVIPTNVRSHSLKRSSLLKELGI